MGKRRLEIRKKECFVAIGWQWRHFEENKDRKYRSGDNGTGLEDEKDVPKNTWAKKKGKKVDMFRRDK